MEDIRQELRRLCSGLPVDPLPPSKSRDPSLPHAPTRVPQLTDDERKDVLHFAFGSVNHLIVTSMLMAYKTKLNALALTNALRYFPSSLHPTLVGEFADELQQYGHIYMYRFVPEMEIRAYPIDCYPTRCRQAAAIMLMIMNNLDRRVAQFPQELVTYGGNGQVFSNWAQFWLTMNYLSEMTDDQTLVMYSGHPLGLFPSSVQAPRAVITNGMVIPNYSSRDQYEKLFALGVTMYGQMTAGSYCYIGPQGIVHGTTLTILNAGRRYLGVDDLAGKVVVTSGLGGMSGAQAKAAVVCGCVGVIAEVSREAIEKRHSQGWLDVVIDNLDDLVARIRQARLERRPLSIGYHGNVVDVWKIITPPVNLTLKPQLVSQFTKCAFKERLVTEAEQSGDLLVELGTDQTSLHNPFNGGYYPVQIGFDEAREVMHADPEKFRQLVTESLKRQVNAINKLAKRGMYFWDYGNAFLLEALRAGADVGRIGNESGNSKFRYPSYVEHIMGDIFSLGFGPFRWVCTSGTQSDLETTDRIATDVLEKIIAEGVSGSVEQQYVDNIKWIRAAGQHKLVVGSQARILYSDRRGRIAIATAFNDAVANGTITGPVVISRDHHDVSGTDSPYRETANIYDGSALCADMAVQNVIGDSFRGATWVALHNGGGVGWGEVINGGFGLVLDGSKEAGNRARDMLSWDVNNGVARRCWAGNDNANEAIRTAMVEDGRLRVTLPHPVRDPDLLNVA